MISDETDIPRVVLKIAGIVMSLLLALTLLVNISKIAIDKIDCEQYGKAANLEVESTIRACYVKTSRGLIERDRYQLSITLNINK